MRNATAFLSARGIGKRFGEVDALADVSFDVHGGEIVGLIGPNGAGKTTLMECLVGLVPVDAGEVLLAGRPARGRDRHEAMFYLPDGVVPYGDQAVGDVLGFFGQVFGCDAAVMAGAIRDLDLRPVLSKRVETLSKGYRRRVMLALAFIAPHPLLVLDEPFDGFDLKQAKGITALLRRVRDGGRTMLLSIHQLGDAQRTCDRFVLMAAGRVVGEGALDDLRAKAGSPSGNLEEVFLALT